MTSSDQNHSWRERFLEAELMPPCSGSSREQHDWTPLEVDHWHFYRDPPARHLKLLQRHELQEMVERLGQLFQVHGQDVDVSVLSLDQVQSLVDGAADTMADERASAQAKARELEEMSARLHGAEVALKEVQAQSALLQAQLGMVLGSLSFRLGRRVTLPFRLLRGISRRALRLLREPALFRVRLVRLRQALSRQGWRGVLQRLAQPGDGGLLSPYVPFLEQDEYARWRQVHGTLEGTARQALTDWVNTLERPPLFSVVMPVFNTDPALLRSTLDSLRAQIYPHWELCVADDASSRQETREVLQEAAAQDARVRVVWRDTNGHISRASNSALALVRGQYVVLMDHDDLLSEDALCCVARTVIARPGLGLIYSDEDKVDQQGRHYDPYFKPDWNPDLLRSQNYVNHLCVYRADLVREVGGFREGFEGSQDYDLLLRVSERLTPSEVAHIPRILYHWRAVAGSEALESGVKNYARDSARRALEEHLARCGVAGEVLESAECPGMWRIRYPLPDPAPRVSVIIPTRNGLVLLTRCLETLLHRTDYPDLEILVVDNGSDDPAVLGYLAGLAERDRIRVIRDDRPFNFSALNNAAAMQATGQVLVLLNNDVEIIHEDWLRELVSHALRPEIGVVGARLWFPDDTLQHGGVVLGIGGVAGHAFKGLPRGKVACFGRTSLIQNYSAVTAACLAVRRDVFMEVGGLDEQGLAVAFNDIDFCIKVREQGYRNLWTPHAELYHHESASRGYEDTPEKQRRFAGEVGVMLDRWGPLLGSDPAYNPNLSLERDDFSLAWSPRDEAVSP